MVAFKRQNDELLARRDELVAAAKGDKGEKGDKGDPGDPPEHEWKGTKLRFKKPDGTWGPFVDLKGQAGKSGTIVVGSDGGGMNLNTLQPGLPDVEPSALVVQQGGSWVNLPWAALVTTIAGAIDMAANAKRIDFIGDTLMYRGEAAPGALETDPVWRIKRVEFGADGDVTETWANGSADFSNAWADRASLTYV